MSKSPLVRRKAAVKGKPVAIDKRLCKQCGICTKVCPKNVLAIGKDRYPEVVNPEKCSKCRLCELMCPDFSITVEGKD